MNVTQDLSILHLILEASAVVQAVMALLAGVSFMSWYYIFMKWFTVRQAREKTETFERDFWSGGDLNNLFNSAVNDRHHAGSMERIFESGFREFTKLKGQKNFDSKDTVDGSRRAMRATYQREMDSLESHLAFLASVGSVSPYIGLFGTVWGIMHAFRGPPTSVRQRSLRSPRALPRPWSPPPSACSQPFPPCLPTTAFRTISTDWRRATKVSWKNFPIFCSVRFAKPCASVA